MTDWISKDRNTQYAFPQAVRHSSSTPKYYVASVIDRDILLPSLSGVLVVSPSAPVHSTGQEGGPFSVESVVYTLTNIGGAAINWSAASDRAWIALDVLSGHLDAGASTNVVASIGAGSLTPSPFDYEASISFVNTTNGDGDTTRSVSVYVTGDFSLSLDGRQLSGTGELIGYSEFASPSTPPKKYRKKEYTGGLLNRTAYSGALCTGIATCDGTKRSGYCEYDALTGALNIAAQTEVYSGGGCPTTTLINTIVECPVAFVAIVGTTLTQTKTTCTRTGDNACNLRSGNWEIFDGEHVQTLSIEDSEDDAITRMVNAGSWSAWSSISSIGDESAAIELRSSGFTFSAVAAQFRASGSGLVPNTAYTGTVEVYRRQFGTSDPWVSIGTSPISGSSDGLGIFSYSSDVECEAGYEYCVFNATITIL